MNAAQATDGHHRLLHSLRCCLQDLGGSRSNNRVAFGTSRYCLEELVRRNAAFPLSLIKHILERFEQVQDTCAYEQLVPLTVLLRSAIMQTPWFPEEGRLLDRAVACVRPFLAWPVPYCNQAASLLAFLRAELRAPGIAYQRLVRQEHGLETGTSANVIKTILLLDPTEVSPELVCILKGATTELPTSRAKHCARLVCHGLHATLGPNVSSDSLFEALLAQDEACLLGLAQRMADTQEEAAVRDNVGGARLYLLEALSVLKNDIDSLESSFGADCETGLQAVPVPLASCIPHNWRDDNLDFLYDVLEKEENLVAPRLSEDDGTVQPSPRDSGLSQTSITSANSDIGSNALWVYDSGYEDCDIDNRGRSSSFPELTVHILRSLGNHESLLPNLLLRPLSLLQKKLQTLKHSEGSAPRRGSVTLVSGTLSSHVSGSPTLPARSRFHSHCFSPAAWSAVNTGDTTNGTKTEAQSMEEDECVENIKEKVERWKEMEGNVGIDGGDGMAPEDGESLEKGCNEFGKKETEDYDDEETVAGIEQACEEEKRMHLEAEDDTKLRNMAERAEARDEEEETDLTTSSFERGRKRPPVIPQRKRKEGLKVMNASSSLPTERANVMGRCSDRATTTGTSSEPSAVSKEMRRLEYLRTSFASRSRNDSSDSQARCGTIRLLVFGGDRALGKLARAYHKFQQHEAIQPVIVGRFHLEFYYVPLTPPQTFPGQQNHTGGLAPECENGQQEELGHGASLLGRVDPWYDRNVLCISNIVPSFRKKPGDEVAAGRSDKEVGILADMLMHYCRFASSPLPFPLFQVELTLASGERRHEVFALHLELGFLADRRAIHAAGKARNRFGVEGDQEAVPLALSVTYYKRFLSGRTRKHSADKHCTSIKMERDSKLEGDFMVLKLTFMEVIKRSQGGKGKALANQQLAMTQAWADKVSIRRSSTKRSSSFAICFDQDENKIFQNIIQCDVNLGIVTNIDGSASSQHLPHGANLNRFCFPLNLFSFLSPLGMLGTGVHGNHNRHLHN
uniref:phosphoinositide 3-kinase regulatory subunit 5-like n=1 Tax=Myxine glutinosa TaxID=7769 RepID=UPI00358F51C9